MKPILATGNFTGYLVDSANSFARGGVFEVIVVLGCRPAIIEYLVALSYRR